MVLQHVRGVLLEAEDIGVDHRDVTLARPLEVVVVVEDVKLLVELYHLAFDVEALEGLVPHIDPFIHIVLDPDLVLQETTIYLECVLIELVVGNRAVLYLNKCLIMELTTLSRLCLDKATVLAQVDLAFGGIDSFIE